MRSEGIAHRALVGARGHWWWSTTDDAVLVAPRDRAQDVKRLVERLQAAGRAGGHQHRRVYRPWGCYEG